MPEIRSHTLLGEDAAESVRGEAWGHTDRAFTSEPEIRKDRYKGHHLWQELVERVDLDLWGGYDQFSAMTLEDMTYLGECNS